MRENIFDILANDYNIEDEIDKLDELLKNKQFIISTERNYSLWDIFDSYLIKEWSIYKQTTISDGEDLMSKCVEV